MSLIHPANAAHARLSLRDQVGYMELPVIVLEAYSLRHEFEQIQITLESWDGHQRCSEQGQVIHDLFLPDGCHPTDPGEPPRCI